MWTYDLIARSKLYLASPLSFNDPYDCLALAVLDGREKELADLLAEYSPRATATDRERAVEMLRNDPEFKRHVQDEARRQLELRQAVCSFASDSDDSPAHSNLLLWGHYADHHKGVCLEFDLERLQKSFPNSAPVSYSNQCDPIDVFDVLLASDDDAHQAERLANWVLTKAECWRYENEWRIYGEGVGVRSFPPECLTKVILGARTPPDDQNMVQEWLAERPIVVPVCRADLQTNEFRIRIATV
jgi:hypothetical protein